MTNTRVRNVPDLPVPRWGRPHLAPAAAVLLVLATTACSAKVKQDVFDQTVAELRGDMADLDARVGNNTTAIQENEILIGELRNDLEALTDEFSDMQAMIIELEDGLRFVTPVHFDFDRADIRSQDEPLLDRFARVIDEHYPSAIVTVEGFADPAGPAAYNRALSERRASNVATYLTERGGLAQEVVRIAAYGEDRQVVPGAQGPGRAGLENRRVTFVIEFGGNLPTETVASRDGNG